MAGGIKGITIEIGGDTTKLDKALKDVNKTSADLKKQLKEVNDSLKFNPGNAELVAQKQRILGESIENTERKLAKLTEAQESAKKAVSEGKMGQEQYEALTREVLKTENQLKSLKSQLDEVNSKWKAAGEAMQSVGGKMTSAGEGMTKAVTVPIAAIGKLSFDAFNEVDGALDTVITKTGATGEMLDSLQSSFEAVYGSLPVSAQAAGDAIGEVNTQFQQTGKELEDTSALFLKFATINGTDVTQSVQLAKGAMEAYDLSAKDVPGILDAVTKAGQDTGVSADKLFDGITKGAPQIKSLGLNVAEAAQLMGSLEQKGIDSSKALSYLTKAQVVLAKDGKTLSGGLEELKEKLAGAATEEEKITLAAELFGSKGAPFMLDALQRGALDLGAFGQAAANAAGVTETTFEATQDPIDQATIAMNNLKTAGSALAAELQTVAIPIFAAIVEAVKAVTTWFRDLPEPMKRTILVFGAVAAAVGPVIVVLGTIIGKLGALITFFSAGGAGATAFGAVVAALSGPVGIVVAAIGALIAIGVLLYQNWDTIKETAGQLGKWLSTKWDEIKTAAAEKWEGIKTAIGTKWDAAKTAIETMAGNIATAVSAKWDAMKTEAAEKWEGIKMAIQDPMKKAREFVKEQIEKIKGLFNFKWELPKIELPHFDINGSFSINPPSVPELDVKWYDRGGIFRSPQVIGVGEKRPEFVGALDDMKEIVRSVVLETQSTNASRSDRTEMLLEKMLDKLDSLNQTMAEQPREMQRLGRLGAAMP